MLKSFRNALIYSTLSNIRLITNSKICCAIENPSENGDVSADTFNWLFLKGKCSWKYANVGNTLNPTLTPICFELIPIPDFAVTIVGNARPCAKVKESERYPEP